MRRAEQIGRLAAACTVCALLAVTAFDIFKYPDRISVLSNLTVDAPTYDAIGLDLANRHNLDAIPPRQPPGFVTLLALVFSVFGHSWIAAKLALWSMLVAITVMSGWLARRMYGSSLAGWIAALLCASSPALGWYALTLQYELLAALFTIVLVALAVSPPAGARHVTVVRAAVIGVVAGAAVLTREVLIVLVPVVALSIALQARAAAGTRAAVRAGGACALVAAVMVVGWSLVQSARAGHPIGITDKGPLVMIYGNNPLANGTFNASLAGLAEPSGFAFMRAEPLQASRLAVRKVLYFWGVLRDGWNVPRPAAIWASRAFAGAVPLEYLLPWARGGWIGAALVLALVMWPRATWRRWWSVPAAIGLVMLVHVITLSSHRFAVPIVPLAFVVVAGVVSRVLHRVWERPPLRAITGVAIVAAAVLQLVEWPLTYRLRAVDMDGSYADSVRDEVTGHMVREAGMAPGARSVVLLIDEFLPAGAFDVGVAARIPADSTIDQPPAADVSVARMTVVALDGTQMCAREVTAGDLAPDRDAAFHLVSLPCRLDRSGPVTLTIDTLAVAPLRFSEVTFAGRR